MELGAAMDSTTDSTTDPTTDSATVRRLMEDCQKLKDQAVELYLTHSANTDVEGVDSGNISPSHSLLSFSTILSRILNEERTLECEVNSQMETGKGGAVDKVVMKELTRVREMREIVQSWESTCEDCTVAASMLGESGISEMLSELSSRLAVHAEEVEAMMVKASFKGKYDDEPCCRFVITAGAGGTEACDWVEMLGRMYVNYFNSKGWNVKTEGSTKGDVVGYKSLEVKVKGEEGEYVYGKLKMEKGAHRLVRISPFNSQGKRMTTFAAVEVNPELEGRSFGAEMEGVE
eukprot:CAMPEP_0118656750 /NCGR_PEP_ID=MMETSP0785-20121206/13649_1 /TAXON_ID=91992 /ORGANISM="Bolidomonas pacifica, Strain CCMP 1866" /LENGTH=289 /DNA_ID=CAMNT_0006549617 /DNA_START=212 /DNA_END=1078 /DNA_ORIENTATION=+